MENILSKVISQFSMNIGSNLTTILGAILFFIIGWIIALIIASLARKLFKKLNLNGHIKNNLETLSEDTDIERIASRLMFWFVFLFAITGTLNMLDLQNVSAPIANLLTKILAFVPSLIGAAVLALIGWLVATLVRTTSKKALQATSLDNKLSEEAGVAKLSNNIATLFYWLIILLFIPMVLQALGIQGLLEPVKHMIDKVISFFPNFMVAGLLAFAGYVLARVLRGMTTNIVATLNIQSLVDKAGLGSQTNIANALGVLVFLLVMIPTLTASLAALKISAISEPGINMLNKVMSAIPNIAMAGLLLLITYFMARFTANILNTLLENTGINDLPGKMGIAVIFAETRLSAIVGYLVIFFAMVFASTEASNLLGFTHVSDLLNDFIQFGSSMLLGTAILMIGFWLANHLANLVNKSQNSPWLGNLIRVLVIGLVIAMGLRAMGIADSIVNLAFGLTLGSVAVAFALAFGLGGQNSADRVLKNFIDSIEQDKKPD